jgi:hypothetical protein
MQTTIHKTIQKITTNSKRDRGRGLLLHFRIIIDTNLLTT